MISVASPPRPAVGTKHVFLSYCRDNAVDVAKLRGDLIAAGEAVWWDQDVIGGQDWRQEIRRAIKQAYAVVLCLSAELTTRPQAGVYPEVLDAIATFRTQAPGTTFLIPIRLSQCAVPNIEIDNRTLERLQLIDLFPNASRAAGLRKLLEALRASPSHP